MENKNFNLTEAPIVEGSLKTEIGILEYLWFEKDGEPVVCYLGTKSDTYGISPETGLAEQNLTFMSDIDKKKDGDTLLLNEYMRKMRYTCHSNENLTIKEKNSKKIENEILRYLKGISLEIKLNYIFLNGTNFEKKVWIETSKIPYGKILSYGKIADLSGNPRACRAVGNALGKNPLIIIIPCHRVIKSDGSLGGFGGGYGENLKVKRFLLDLEQASVQNF